MFRSGFIFLIALTIMIARPPGLQSDISVLSTESTENSFIDWAHLKNPVLALPDRALKDQAVVDEGGWFYIFASNRFSPNDEATFAREMRFYRTRDFKSYEPFFDPDLIVHEQGRPGFPESPDVTRIQGAWYMVFQSRFIGQEHYRLYYSTSQDLLDWTPAQEIAPNNRPKERQIDGALAEEGGYFYLGYKGQQKFYVTRSVGPTLDGNWLAARRASAGGKWAENFQFLKIDGSWRMIATARDPKGDLISEYTRNHFAYLYTMSGAGQGTEFSAWTRWTDMRKLEIPEEGWNKVMLDNSAYLCDWRKRDGYFYLFYAGSNDDTEFQRQSHAKIGVARSRDLIHWRVAGDTQE